MQVARDAAARGAATTAPSASQAAVGTTNATAANIKYSPALAPVHALLCGLMAQAIHTMETSKNQQWKVWANLIKDLEKTWRKNGLYIDMAISMTQRGATRVDCAVSMWAVARTALVQATNGQLGHNATTVRNALIKLWDLHSGERGPAVLRSFAAALPLLQQAR